MAKHQTNSVGPCLIFMGSTYCSKMRGWHDFEGMTYNLEDAINYIRSQHRGELMGEGWAHVVSDGKIVKEFKYICQLNGKGEWIDV